jgi:hypothetical protein
MCADDSINENLGVGVLMNAETLDVGLDAVRSCLVAGLERDLAGVGTCLEHSANKFECWLRDLVAH